MKHKHYAEYKKALSLALPPNKLLWGGMDDCPLCKVSMKYTDPDFPDDVVDCQDCPCNLYMRAIFNPDFYPRDQSVMFPCTFLQSFNIHGYQTDMLDGEDLPGWPGFERVLVEIALWYEHTQKYEED